MPILQIMRHIAAWALLAAIILLSLLMLGWIVCLLAGIAVLLVLTACLAQFWLPEESILVRDWLFSIWRQRISDHSGEGN